MQFEVWAPQAGRVTLHCAGATRAMERDPERAGWWGGEAEAADGTRYGFALDDGPVLPDPRSRRQPDGPDGLSAVVDHERVRVARARGRGAGCRARCCTSCTSARTPARAPWTRRPSGSGIWRNWASPTSS